MSTWAQNLAAAIQQAEGYFPGSRSARNSNPGNLRPGASASSCPILWTGQTGCDPQGFAVFTSPSAGQAALVTDLTTHAARNPGQSLAQFLSRYAGGPPASYIQQVASSLGVDPSTPLGAIAGRVWSGPGILPTFTPSTSTATAPSGDTGSGPLYTASALGDGLPGLSAGGVLLLVAGLVVTGLALN